MNKNRLEAFSDGVIAIIITIMVLELKVPHGAEIKSLLPVLPAFLSYALSFIYVGIYWNNHHHMLYTVKTINGRSLWANLNLLFWLSLIPFVTGWMGESNFKRWPIIAYGIILLVNALSYTLLSNTLIALAGENSTLARATGTDWKGKISIGIYLIAIITAWFYPLGGLALYWIVAVIWFIPDKRIERKITGAGGLKSN